MVEMYNDIAVRELSIFHEGRAHFRDNGVYRNDVSSSEENSFDEDSSDEEVSVYQQKIRMDLNLYFDKVETGLVEVLNLGDTLTIHTFGEVPFDFESGSVISVRADTTIIVDRKIKFKIFMIEDDEKPEVLPLRNEYADFGIFSPIASRATQEDFGIFSPSTGSSISRPASADSLQEPSIYTLIEAFDTLFETRSSRKCPKLSLFQSNFIQTEYNSVKQTLNRLVSRIPEFQWEFLSLTMQIIERFQDVPLCAETAFRLFVAASGLAIKSLYEAQCLGNFDFVMIYKMKPHLIARLQMPILESLDWKIHLSKEQDVESFMVYSTELQREALKLDKHLIF